MNYKFVTNIVIFLEIFRTVQKVFYESLNQF